MTETKKQLKIELNVDTEELVEEIAQRVIKAIKPLISKTEDNTIFTVKTLAKYLGVTEHWLYERNHFKEIPYYKIGGLVRYRKNDIDTWLDSLKTPGINTLSKKFKKV